MHALARIGKRYRCASRMTLAAGGDGNEIGDVR
jgi:hypothetical protein